eukprot:691808-Pelagomonas_calceolata.AAC.1
MERFINALVMDEALGSATLQAEGFSPAIIDTFFRSAQPSCVKMRSQCPAAKWCGQGNQASTVFGHNLSMRTYSA